MYCDVCGQSGGFHRVGCPEGHSAENPKEICCECNEGIYVDDEGEEHIVYNLCPHMKCSLIFNEIEKTWDCPCHGSRFNIDGKSIEGPSNYDITYSEE